MTLRGLVLNAAPANGIAVNSVGTLNVESCFITGFNSGAGVVMNSGGRLNVKETVSEGNGYGIGILGAQAVLTRGNSTIAGNASGDTSGTIATFLAK